MNFHKGEKTVGILKDGVFRKKIDMAKHFMRKNRSFGIDFDTFQELDPNTKIELVSRDKTYSATWLDFATWGTIENFGHGRQIFLNIDKFKVN